MSDTYWQDPPFSLGFNLTHGCNFRCPFCGINAIDVSKMEYMDLRIVEHTCEMIKEDGWNCRIGLGTHGEPSLHPDLLKVIDIIRTILPKHHISMISNGAGIIRRSLSYIDEIMTAGVNVLMLDDYGHSDLVRRIKGGYTGHNQLYYYPTDQQANPHKRRKVTEHHIVIVESIDIAKKGNHSRINNRAGCAYEGIPNIKEGRRCANPFRDFTVRYNGNVPICCVDFRGVIKCGNVLDVNSLEEIWNGEVFSAIRRFMYHGMRSKVHPCRICDAVGYRLGFLPDKKGLMYLPEPNELDVKAIAKGTVNGPCVKIKKLPWE